MRASYFGLALAALISAAALLFIDRVIAGFGQCEAARTCPFETEIGGRP